MKSALLLVPAIAALSACQQPKDVSAGKAWVRLAAVPSNPSAAYFTLKGGPRDATLTGVSTAAAIRSEMHESMNAGGMMSMAPLKLVALRAGGEVTFAPGGKHVMLYGLKAQAGGSVPLTFTFADGKTLTTAARVVGAGDSAPE
ncbi:MAG TPA: copper chaperone PCu(A)C [Sphingomonas sp.]